MTPSLQLSDHFCAQSLTWSSRFHSFDAHRRSLFTQYVFFVPCRQCDGLEKVWPIHKPSVELSFSSRFFDKLVSYIRVTIVFSSGLAVLMVTLGTDRDQLCRKLDFVRVCI